MPKGEEPAGQAETVTAASTVAETSAAPVEPAPPIEPSGDAGIQETVLEIVAGMTGYPADMLDMDLDLEADLGIDTVKQAEIFAALREAYGIPRDENLQLNDFPTLNHAVDVILGETQRMADIVRKVGLVGFQTSTNQGRHRFEIGGDAHSIHSSQQLQGAVVVANRCSCADGCREEMDIFR